MKIWTFGDSWTWGSELWDDSIHPHSDEKYLLLKWGANYTFTCRDNIPYVHANRWTGILETLGYDDIHNYSSPGISNLAILESMTDRIRSGDPLPDLIIISWTTQYRYAERKDDWIGINPPHYRYQVAAASFNDVVFEDAYYNTVNTAFSVAHEYGVKILNIDAFHRNTKCNEFPKHIEYVTPTLLSMATGSDDLVKSTPKDWHLLFVNNSTTHPALATDGHPNEIGHRAIATYLHENILGKYT